MPRPDYGGGMEADPTQIARWVQLRMDRQAVLHQEAPPRLNVIIDEFVLRREIGGTDVLRGQLAHLLATAELPHVDLRVLPASIGAHAGHSGYFLVFSIAEPDMDVGFAETVGGAVYVEPPDSERFVRVYDRLLDSALGPAESAEFVRAIGEDHVMTHPGQVLGPNARADVTWQISSYSTAPTTAGVASRQVPCPMPPAGLRCGTATTQTVSLSSSARPPGRRSSAASRTTSSLRPVARSCPVIDGDATVCCRSPWKPQVRPAGSARRRRRTRGHS